MPRDLGGPASIISADRFWPQLEDALGHWQDGKYFLAGFDHASRRDVTPRLQAITFWALFTHKGHTTPKKLFANVKSREPLALAVLNPEEALADDPVVDNLTSIFCPRGYKAHFGDGTVMPSFVSPFGPSALHCGQPGCPAKFYSENDLQSEPVNVLAIRARCADHFSKVYGIGNTFNSQIGLPDPTQAVQAPTSYHNTLHIRTARMWSQLNLKRKQAFPQGISGGNEPVIAAFVKEVRFEICARNHRCDAYFASIENEVRSILPSFLETLRVASDKMGLEDKTGMAFVHDFNMKNTVLAKIDYELSL